MAGKDNHAGVINYSYQHSDDSDFPPVYNQDLEGKIIKLIPSIFNTIIV